MVPVATRTHLPRRRRTSPSGSRGPVSHTLKRSRSPTQQVIAPFLLATGEHDDRSIADTLLPELEQEMASTRRVIERVADADPNWKPRPESFSSRQLAQLLPWLP